MHGQNIDFIFYEKLKYKILINTITQDSMCYWVFAEPCCLYAVELSIDLKQGKRKKSSISNGTQKENQNAWTSLEQD